MNMKISLAVKLSIAHTILLGSTLASADSSNSNSDGIIEQIVVSASHLATEPVLVSSAAAINEQQIKRASAMHIAQLLNDVPGVQLAQGSGQEYLPSIRSAVLTGAGACGSVRVAYDGVPVRAAGFCNVNELFDVAFETADTLVVVRGPASVRYGSNAQLGAVNIIGKQATHGTAATLGMQADSLGATGVTATLNGKLTTGVAGRIELVDKHDSGHVDDSGFKHHKGRAQVASDNGWSVSAQWSDLNQQTAGYLSGYQAYKDEELRLSNSNPEAYRHAKSASVVAAYDNDEGRQLSLYARDNSMQFLMHFLPGQPTERNGHSSLGIIAKQSGNIDSYAWVIGTQLELTDGYLQQWQDQPTEGSGFLQATIPDGLQYNYQVEATALSGFGELSKQLGERVQIASGVRFDYTQYDYDNKMVSGRTDDQGMPCSFGGCRYSRPDDRSDEFDDLSGFVGLRVELSPAIQAYANLSSGYRAPQATELYRLQRAQQVADLSSESTRSVELGLVGSYAKLAYEVAGYAMQRSDLIFRDENYFNQSGAKTRHSGIEFSGRYQFNDRWSASVAGSYARHQYADAGTGDISIEGLDIDSAPRWLANASVSYQANKALYQLRANVVDRYATDPSNLHFYEGHELLDAIAQFDLGNGLQLNTQVLNVLNTRYADRADYSGFTGDRYFVGRERRLLLGVNWHY